jgi:dTDP-glucose 4,6-dehydratase
LNSPAIKVLKIGSNYSPRVVAEICSDNNIECLINFAAQSMVSESWQSPWDWYETNVVWLSRLSHEIIRWGKLQRWIQFTTPEVYGSNNDWIKESQIFDPSTPYANSRAAGDWHLYLEFKRSLLPVILTRTANVYGPFQQRYRLVPNSLISAATQNSMNLHGGGKSRRSFIFVTDVTNALIRIMYMGHIGETYHISTKSMHEIRHVASLAFELYGLEPNKFLETVEDRPGKDLSYMLNSQKIREELGWSDSTSLLDGMTATKNWVDSWLETLLQQPSSYLHLS